MVLSVLGAFGCSEHCPAIECPVTDDLAASEDFSATLDGLRGGTARFCRGKTCTSALLQDQALAGLVADSSASGSGASSPQGVCTVTDLGGGSLRAKFDVPLDQGAEDGDTYVFEILPPGQASDVLHITGKVSFDSSDDQDTCGGGCRTNVEFVPAP